VLITYDQRMLAETKALDLGPQRPVTQAANDDR
jgi:hypothetical protein